MEERRFMIIDFNSRPGNKRYIEYKEEDVITESELINRFDQLRSIGFITSQQAIELMLTGRIKEE